MIQLLLIVIYISFISLGLPDGLLGAGWPSMYPQMDVPVSYSGIVFFIICMGTVISSLQSDRLTRSFGTGRVTAMSVGLTAAALLGFAASRHFWQLCLWAIPYGLGAGSVDASLNNYVALNYKSRHMSWLHCMWGIGASVGPYIMSAVLTGGSPWHRSYLLVGIVQLVRHIRYRKNDDYREKVDVAVNDERNRFLTGKAWAWAGYLFVLVCGVATIALKIAGQDQWSLAASYALCLLLVLYWGAYLVLKRKY